MYIEGWNLKKKSRNCLIYYIVRKLPSGQSIKLEIECEEFLNSYRSYIYLSISHKRKNIDNTFLQLNGKDGISSLLWAKQKILDFENVNKLKKKNIMIINWDDNRRRDVYYRGLKNVGYKYGYIDGYKCLYKLLEG